MWTRTKLEYKQLKAGKLSILVLMFKLQYDIFSTCSVSMLETEVERENE